MSGHILCAALVVLPDANLCRNGFMTGPGCERASGGIYTPAPECCREEHCGKKYEATGGRPMPFSAWQTGERVK